MDIIDKNTNRPDVRKLLSYQSRVVKLRDFQDEFEIIKQLQQKQAKLQNSSENCLEEMKKSATAYECTNSAGSESRRLRELGNREFTNKSAQRNILRACRFYTEAIFKAGNNKKELCLAYANRAMALQEFGYYQQAYDDCKCALMHGYPDHLHIKLFTRQGVCAYKLKDVTALERHIQVLEQRNLNDSFKAELHKLKCGLQELQAENTLADTKAPIQLNRHSQKILHGPKGRYMIATEDISENTHIFTECAASFVPVGGSLICQQCAATQLIPIPCEHCHGNVVYCSLKCHQEHATIHAHECVAYQFQLLQQIGIAHLAMRVTIESIPQILTHLDDIKDGQQIWHELVDSKSSLVFNKSIAYAGTLRMITHLSEMSKPDILTFALVAQLLVTYMLYYTKFFDIFARTAADNATWQTIISALILRGIGQLICNAHTNISIMPVPELNYERCEFALLQSELWASPYNVRLGKLHYYAHHTAVAAMNLPYLSVCNHACAQSFQPKFNGRIVSTYATRKITANSEITNCYTLDYRKSKYCYRRSELLNVYHFVCDCTHCTRNSPDQDYESFHRYLCENPNCKKVFVPKLPHRANLNWFQSGDSLICSICDAKQTCKWYEKLQKCLENMQTPPARFALYDCFRETHNWLLDYNALKLHLAEQILINSFSVLDAGAQFASNEFPIITEILKFMLSAEAIISRSNSIEYISKFTYLWDIIALGQYKCSQAEMQEMLDALDIIADEHKNIFRRYYHNFITPFIL